MAVYKFQLDISDSRSVELPVDIPKGRLDITATTEEPFSQERFQQMLQEVVSGPFHTRTKEDIDRELRLERDSWE